MKKISLAITEFALPAPRRGSIEALSGFGREMGQEIHEIVQARRAKENPKYQAEVPSKHVFEYGGYAFAISGRMDGFVDVGGAKTAAGATGGEGEGGAHIEEIKSTFNIYELIKRLRDLPYEHPYSLQLRTYGYFHYKATGRIPRMTFHLVSTRDFKTEDVEISLDIEEYEKWLARRLDELVEETKLAEKRAKRRRKAAEELEFPFSHPRPGQVELIATIEKGIEEGRPMMLQAPTGLGKTVGVLYPSLKESLARGQKVVYVTPKNSQHAVAEEAVEKMQELGAGIKSMTITAKSKMCFKNEPLCNPEYCEYAKDHYTKVAEAGLIPQLAKKKNLTARVFKKMAEEHQVCPFELQLDAAQEADTVICDYNYVFAPRSAFGRLAQQGIDQEGGPNLVIDEAHNLPGRALDYYSPALSVYTLERFAEDVKSLPLKFRTEFQSLIAACVEVVKSCGPAEASKPLKIKAPAMAFMEQDEELRGFLSKYLADDIDIQPRDPVLRLSFYWSEFTAALEFVREGHPEFFTTFHPRPATVKITCCDASEMLRAGYNEYENVVAFSATIKPFEFYSRLSGLDAGLKTAEFSSPFPRENRKLLVIPQISSKYSERERNYPRVADAIAKIAGLRRGNYFAFFPSFDFMERVLGEFIAPAGFQIIRQERGLKREGIDEVLLRLKEPGGAHIVFAVQGGVFSEGVDYPGDMIIGAFVVGPPLPSFDLEREEMRAYYESLYGSGFDYAYTYPAMAKAVQAAGRVIRSETDRGLIVLMDNRFLHPSYMKSMPSDWVESDDAARELVSESILSDVSAFWRESEI